MTCLETIQTSVKISNVVVPKRKKYISSFSAHTVQMIIASARTKIPYEDARFFFFLTVLYCFTLKTNNKTMRHLKTSHWQHNWRIWKPYKHPLKLVIWWSPNEKKIYLLIFFTYNTKDHCTGVKESIRVKYFIFSVNWTPYL